jgi:dTDP-4-dehydrorhamnose reductase
MNIFAIGGSGLVGSRVVELLEKKHSFTSLSLRSGIDITRSETLDVVRDDRDHEAVILLAAKTDVDGCEEDRRLGEEGEAWRVNVNGVKNVVDACSVSGKKIIYISTDFVFGGDDTPPGGYTEENAPNPVNWYGETKHRGEEIVRNSGIPYVIARIAYPYRSEFAPKKDFARAILERLKNNQPVAAVTDHIFTPTFIDDIAYALDKLIEREETGIFHVTGSRSLSPYDAAVIIAEKFGLDKTLISRTTRAEYFAGKAERPLNVSINNDKINKLEAEMKTFEEGLNFLL